MGTDGALLRGGVSHAPDLVLIRQLRPVSERPSLQLRGAVGSTKLSNAFRCASAPMCPYFRLMSATVEGDQPMMEATTARLAPRSSSLVALVCRRS